jgi:hypothetical protein
MARFSRWDWLVPDGTFYRDERGQLTQNFRLRLWHPYVWFLFMLALGRGLADGLRCWRNGGCRWH